MEIKKIDYHRNGICGAGFHIVIFDDKKEKLKNMVAFVFEGQGNIAVINIDELSKHNIEFAQGNSWRGDHFESEIREAIKQDEDKGKPITEEQAKEYFVKLTSDAYSREELARQIWADMDTGKRKPYLKDLVDSQN